MSGHWDAPHADRDAHHPLNHHGHHGHGADTHHGEKAGHDGAKPHAWGDHGHGADTHHGEKADHNHAPSQHTTNNNHHIPSTSDGRSSLIKGVTTIYNTTAGAIGGTAFNIGHGGINAVVRTTAGTISGIRDTIKQTAHEIQDNFSTASRKDKWYKRWAGYLWSILSTPGIIAEWAVRTITEPINTAKWVADVAANTVIHQAKTFKAIGTSTPPSQINTHRTRETRKQPAWRKEKFWLNPRHRYNKILNRSKK